MMPLMAKKKPSNPESQTPQPNRKGMPLHVWLDPVLVEAFEAYVRGVRPKTTKTAVVEQALQQFLSSLGVWPAEDSEAK